MGAILRQTNLRGSRVAAIIPGDSAAEIVGTAITVKTLNWYNVLLGIRLLATWIPQLPPSIIAPIATITDPFLGAFRGLLPSVGGLDFSPIIAFAALDFITNSVSALPAELPAEISHHAAQ